MFRSTIVRSWRPVVARGVVALALGLGASCSPSYVTDSAAPVNLYLVSLNGGAQLDSDVRNGENSTFVCEDEIKVEVSVRNKNPNAPTPSVPSAVFLRSYEVRYFRTDGRGVEGVDVPYRITGNLTLAVDVATSGSTEFPVEVVRRQAKLEPPLSSINQATVLTVMAEVTVYGETTTGKAVSASGRMQIDFADFGDKETTCPVKN